MPEICSHCNQEIVPPELVNGFGGTGFAEDAQGNIICYACCAIRDKADMLESGKAVLYLTQKFEQFRMPSRTSRRGYAAVGEFEIINWPGTLKFRTDAMHVGAHNLAGRRYDVWFDVDGESWHGVQYGDDTQILHCRRLKGRHAK